VAGDQVVADESRLFVERLQLTIAIVTHVPVVVEVRR